MSIPPDGESEKALDEILKEGLRRLHEKVYDKATSLFQQALKEAGEFASRELYACFDKAYADGHFEECQAIGNALSETEIQSYIFLNRLGNCERKLKNYIKANQYYKNALKLKPDYILARHNLSAGIARVEKYDAEIATSIKTVSSHRTLLFPEYQPNKNLHKRKEILNLLLKFKKEKEHQLLGALLDEKKKLIKNGANDEIRGITERIKNQLQLEECATLSRGEYDSLLVELLEEKWEKLSNSEQKILEIEVYNLGLSYLEKGEGKKGGDCFLKLLNRNANFFYLEMLMGLSEFMNGPSDSSLNELKSFFAQEPDNRYININLGIIYRERKNSVRSDTHFLLAAKRFEELDGLIYSKDIYNRGEELHSLDRDDKALIFYQTAYKELENPKILNHIGKIYLESENYQEALDTYRQILNMDPSYKPALKTILRIHEICGIIGRQKVRDGEPEEGLVYLKLALDALKDVETLRSMVVCYRKLKNKDAVLRLEKECTELLKKQEKETLEEQFSRLVDGGKKAMKEKKYDKSIQCFEKALMLKPDKNVFVFLAHIYKNLNRTKALLALISNYKNRLKIEPSEDG